MISKKITKETLIDQYLLEFKTDSLIYSYSRLLLQSLSIRELSARPASYWVSFLTDRFDYFSKGVKANGAFWIHSPAESHVHHRWAIDLVFPDARNLFFTLQTVLKEFELKVTLQIHPMMSVSGKRPIKSISMPTDQSSAVYSVVYIEFEEIPERISIDVLTQRIHMHMTAVQLVTQHQADILKRVADVKSLIPTVNELELSQRTEWVALLDWLCNENFLFFGYVLFNDTHTKQSLKTAVQVDTGLGILSDEYQAVDQFKTVSLLADQVQKKMKLSYLFYFDTVNVTSPIQRFVKLMRLSFKIPIGNGQYQEHNFVGLLRRSSLNVKNIETPLIHLKMKYIFKKRNMLVGTHDYNEVIRIFTGIPKYELFRSSKETLLEMVDHIFSITNPNRLHCFTKIKPEFNTFHLFIVFPFNVYNSKTIDSVVSYLKSCISHSMFELTEVYDPDKPRLHIYFEYTSETLPSQDDIEEELNKRVRPWADLVKDMLFEQFSESPFAASKIDQLMSTYVTGMPTHYRVRTSPQSAITDIGYLERVAKQGEIQIRIERFLNESSRYHNQTSVIYVYSSEKIHLIDIMPILENVGLVVLDQLSTRIGCEATVGYLHSYRVTDRSGEPLIEENISDFLTDLLTEVFHKRCENDALNQLVLTASLDYESIRIIRAYRNFYIQLNPPFSKEKINDVLTVNHPSTQLMIDFFSDRFDPDLKDNKSVQNQLRFERSLEQVNDVSDDTILRQLFTLMASSLRTNFYNKQRNSGSAISIKLDSSAVPFMPKPVPYREIFVHDINLQGTHIRFGPVSRGGLRWSSRPDDFRTEVLGLVKTQQTKNVVIVPVGSKGGFVVSSKTGEVIDAAFVEQQYTIYISALLDITDNRDAKGVIIPPTRVVCHDQPDPYLVVAADKGTATFSDIANSVSAQYQFWLGDAFASGGSVGYDHKKEGITARGAWECVRLHFKEMGHDCQTEPFSVVGIGDMSGDVFGNGMLLSPVIALKAAFNHMHIFIDPEPDINKSFKERQRLFKLSGSKWSDYSPALISSGGGVFDRHAKSIQVSSELADLLDIDKKVVSGQELVQYVLKANVDLMWFGGIGTYVKSPSETHLDVGDPSNDSCRIDSSSVRARVIGEGANLGLTQKARMELGVLGCRLNTDAIDNSAGVNMSDYEVNLKILCHQLLQKNVIKTEEDRNAMLYKATDQVAQLCLVNNRLQHRLLTLEQHRSTLMFSRYRLLLAYLIEHANLDPIQEEMPGATELHQLEAEGIGLSRPVLSKLQAYAKMYFVNQVQSDFKMDDPLFQSFYDQYFPLLFQQEFGSYLDGHPLKADILIMQLVNHIINYAGAPFAILIKKFTGCTFYHILKAYVIAEYIFDSETFRQRLFSSTLSAQNMAEALIQFEDVKADFVEGILREKSFVLTLAQAQKYRDVFVNYEAFISVSELYKLKYQSGFDSLPPYPSYFMARDVIYLSKHYGYSVEQSMQFLTGFESVFSLDWIKQQLMGVNPKNNWEQSEQEILRHVVDVKKITLINQMVQSSVNLSDPSHSQLLAFMDYQQSVDQLKHSAQVSLTGLSVVLNMLNLVK